MDLSPSCQATSRSAIQEFPDIFMEPESSLPCSQQPSTDFYPDSVHITPTNCSIIHSNFYPPTYAYVFSFILTFPPKSYMHATCLAYLFLLYLIILIILGEEYKLWSFSVCSFLQPPILFLLGPNILLSSLLSFPNTSSIRHFLNVWQTKFRAFYLRIWYQHTSENSYCYHAVDLYAGLFITELAIASVWNVVRNTLLAGSKLT
jgi:hypothetical protein